MWLTIPDDLQVLLLDKDLVSYATGGAGVGVVLPPSGSPASENPVIVATLAVLTNLALEAQAIVQGHLLSQGVLADPLPAGPNAGLLKNVTARFAVEHLFLRTSGQASEFPPAWDKAIRAAHDTLKQFVNGELPLDPAFFTRGAEFNVPPMSAVMRSSSAVDAAFSREWNLHTRRELA